MLVLALNTAFAALEGAIVRDGEILADARDPMVRGQDRELPDFVERLLAAARVSLDAIDRIAVVTGPGSFTGIRIGVSYARGLSLVTQAECVGVTSLEAAIPAGMAGNTLGALRAQKRPPDQTWWVQGLEGDEGIAPPVEVNLKDLTAILEGLTVPVFIDGPEALGDAIATIDLRPMQPSAITAALKASGFDPEAHPPAPVYAREPDATLPDLKR